MHDLLAGRRVLITQASEFMGPARCTDAAGCFVGQVLPVCGGRAGR